MLCLFFFQAEDGIRDLVRSRGLGDVYKRQGTSQYTSEPAPEGVTIFSIINSVNPVNWFKVGKLSLIHI